MWKNLKVVTSDNILIPFECLAENSAFLSSKKVLAGGCFDLLHVGHIRFLKEAKKQGDNLIIALENDEFIRMRKKREPIYIQNERAEILVSLRYVNWIVLLPFLESDEEYLSLVKNIHPAVIAVTDDDPLIAQKEKQAEAIGSQVKLVIEKISIHSTSNFIHQIKNQK